VDPEEPEKAIFAERDQKLQEARERRKIKRQNLSLAKAVDLPQNSVTHSPVFSI